MENMMAGDGWNLVLHKKRFDPPAYRRHIILHTSIYLPTLGILPVKIKSIKTMLLKELDDMFDKSSASRRVVDQTTVLVTCRVIPSAKCN
jgi:hypothetical protein